MQVMDGDKAKSDFFVEVDPDGSSKDTATKILILSSFAMPLESIIFVCKYLVQCDLIRVTET